jgi:protein-tyrosine sulfotransferase
MPCSTDDLSTARFADIYPKAKFICLHRDPLDVMYSAIAANPWGLDDTSVSRFISPQAGNNVAATAAYWIYHSQRIMRFEQEHPERSIRIRYEDFCAKPDAVVGSLMSFGGPP